MPTRYGLEQNYPNPFNAGTLFQYQLPQISEVELKIYNLVGQEIKTLVNKEQSAGVYTMGWDGTNRNRQHVAGGIYLVRLAVENFVTSKKVLLLK
jgi:flagellar hook assembly protein FlgD